MKECFTLIKENLSKSIKRPENQCFCLLKALECSKK